MSSDVHAIDSSTRRRLVLLFIASALMIASALTGWLRPDQETLRGALALAGAIVVAIPIVSGLVTAIRSTGFAATQFYMDQYVVLALAACLATGKYLTGGIVAIVLLFGQMLEELTTVGVEMALSKLRQLSKIRARRRKSDGTEQETEATELAVDDLIRVLPGETIPADATILSGQALIDQSRITGESVPIEAGPGSKIFAGTVNLNGSIEARVTGSGEDTVMGRVRSIIEEAKDSEAPIISLAEDYARYYTPLILLIAASVFFFTQEIERAIAVLVVSIPCAFVLASPSAMVSAIAAAIESQSNHPVARAISQAAGDSQKPAVSDFTEHHGLGLAGTIGGRSIVIGRPSFLQKSSIPPAIDPSDFTRHSLVLMAVDGIHAATFLLTDTIRPEARETLDRLRALGISDFVMLTGDRSEVAETIAARVGIINQNLLCGFAFIIIAITLSSAGLVSPIAAAFFHEFSAFFVIFNSARLLRFDGLEERVAPQENETTAASEPATA